MFDTIIKSLSAYLEKTVLYLTLSLQFLVIYYNYCKAEFTR